MEISSEEIQKKLSAIEELLVKVNKRLNVMEDVEEIKKLHYNYINSVQRADYANMEEYFAEDAVIEAGPVTKGKSEIGKRFREQISKSHIGKEGCVLIHPIINVNGDRATGSWQLFFMYSHPDTWQSLFWVQGFYDIEYVKENGKWKISYLKHVARLKPHNFRPPLEEDLRNFLQK